MMGPAHRVAGVVAWVAVGPLLEVHGWRLAAGALLAGAAAHGRLSPDCDRYPLLGKVIPGGHRGVTHLWLWPVLALWLASLAGEYRWLVAAVAVGSLSHVLGDAVFGRVPVWPARRGWVRWGLGLKTGGFVERWVAVPVMVCAGAWLVLP